MNYGWIVATVLAAGFQVARNGLQRSLMGIGGPWGATLVRFVFGLPFSGLLLSIAVVLTPGAHLRFSPAFWSVACLGAAAQVLATSSLLTAMGRAGFAVGTALQQSSLPLAALVGLFIFHDRLSPLAWIGVALTTAGLALLTWPGKPSGPKPLSGAMFGLLSGLLFGVGLNAFRHGALTLEPHHRVFAAIVMVFVVQTLQSLGLGAVLLAVRPRIVFAVMKSWRVSLGAGLCGALASTGWFVALALTPAAAVRAVGVVEAPMAAIVGRRLFKERLHLLQLAAGVVVVAGVVLTAFSGAG